MVGAGMVRLPVGWVPLVNRIQISSLRSVQHLLITTPVLRVGSMGLDLLITLMHSRRATKQAIASYV